MSRPKPKHKQMELTEDLRELIQETAAQTVKAATAAMLPSAQINYYRIVERLLQNYKTIQRMLADEERYITEAFADRPERSKDIVLYSSKPAGDGKPDTVTAIEQQRIRSFQRTQAQFEEIERVIARFRDKPEFVVVRMYYFNETADGYDRAGLQPYTWSQITDELSARDILQTDKTARRWRNNLINDIAVCMFGTQAAVAEGVHWSKGLDNPQNMTVS